MIDLPDMKRWRSEQPPDYPEALIKLIDAIRDYLRSDVTLAAELLHEDAITKEQYDEGMAENAPLVEWLKKYESWDVDPSLHGLIKEKR